MSADRRTDTPPIEDNNLDRYDIIMHRMYDDIELLPECPQKSELQRAWANMLRWLSYRYPSQF